MPDGPPFLIGAFLAVNAIPDAYFLLDAMECMFSKARFIQGQHDVFSTLLNCRGENRIMHTDVNVVRVASNFEHGVADGLRAAAAEPGCGVVFCGAIPTCAIAGTDYERIVRDVRPGLDKPVLNLPSRSLSHDWLGGYAAVLTALAEGLDLDDARPEPGKVAVVGYFMDRTEGEHRGNIAEIERMLGGIGLEAVSVWLSNSPVEKLRDARRASAIVSLPHGRQAARALARRLKVPLIETDIPFGLDGTARWVRQVAEKLGRAEAGEAFVGRELASAARRLEWVVPQAFLGRRFTFVGDPHYAEPLAALIEEVGGEMAHMSLLGAPESLDEQARARLAARPGVAFDSDAESSPAQVLKGFVGGSVDLIVTNSDVLPLLQPGRAWIEWGYPSYYTHFFHDEPFLGFMGCVAFMSRMSNAMSKSVAGAVPDPSRA